jgi:chaperonin GroEL
VINVGAATETEMKEKKARVEDALHATRAAVEEGIVPGGGVAYIRSLKALEKLAEENEGDVKVGIQIVRRALEQPLRTLCENAGIEGSLVVEQVKQYKGEDKFTGYDVDGERYVDMFKAGIIDPTKVSRTALQNAASVASLLLTTEALVTEIPEKKKAPAAPGGGGYGGRRGLLVSRLLRFNNRVGWGEIPGPRFVFGPRSGRPHDRPSSARQSRRRTESSCARASSEVDAG